MRLLRNIAAALFLLTVFAVTPQAATPVDSCNLTWMCTQDSKYWWAADTQCFGVDCGYAQAACDAFCGSEFQTTPYINSCSEVGSPAFMTSGACQCFFECIFIPE